jgi:hypothetical protein
MGCRMRIYQQIGVIRLLQKCRRDHGFDVEVPLEDEWMVTTLKMAYTPWCMLYMYITG